MIITHFDQSTFLAARSIAAEQIGPAPDPEHVALPGAKQAISHDRLLAHQDAGHDQREIVERVNRTFEREHADRLADHARWVQGSYSGAIQAMREQAARDHAERLRRQAAFEKLTRES